MQGEGSGSVLSQNQSLLEVDVNAVKLLCSLELIWPVLVALDLRGGGEVCACVCVCVCECVCVCVCVCM